jgi:hypothetical protein
LKCWWACKNNPEGDSEGEKVPDDWERRITRRLVGQKNSFPNAFNSELSASSGGARDFEFYAWICGCFEFGELKRKVEGKWVDIPATDYHSLYFIPKKTQRPQSDWSVLRFMGVYKGEHWDDE